MNSYEACKICGSPDHVVVIDNIRDWEYGVDGRYQYRKCLNCSLVQIHPFPTIEKLIEAYNVDYHGFAVPAEKGVLYTSLYKLVEWIAAKEIKKQIHKDAHVLDVGCGIGLFLNMLKSHGYQNIEGIDFSSRAVAAVNKSGITCHLGTFLDLKKEDSTYDLIAMNNYLEHTMSPLEELKKAWSLLRDGGVLSGEVPNFNSCDRFLFGRYWGGNHVPRHTFQFTAVTLTALLKQAGFRKVNVHYPLNTSHFALSIQNWLQRRCPDMKNNKKLIHGRSKYYSLYMMALVPINILCVVFKKTGFMRFKASR